MINFNSLKNFSATLIVAAILLSCNGNKKSSTVAEETPSSAVTYAYFSDTAPVLVSSTQTDSILRQLKSGDNLLFTKLYPIADTLPTRSDDSLFILADGLEKLGYQYVTGGSGNFEKGPRMINLVYESDSLRYDVFKAYQSYQMQADSNYNMLVFEQVICTRK